LAYADIDAFVDRHGDKAKRMIAAPTKVTDATNSINQLSQLNQLNQINQINHLS